MVNHSNSLRLLGVSEIKDLLAFVPVKITALCGLQIRAVSSGVEHITVLTKDGRIYSWGKTYSADNKTMIRKPQFLSGNLEGKRVLEVACGQAHTLVLTDKGEVYSWGYNIYGQLGTGSTTSEPDAVEILGPDGFDKNILSVACTGWSSFALGRTGNVWSWGHHQVGALGYACSEHQLVPRKIALSGIKKLAAGSAHILALSNANEVYFWGNHASDTRIVTPNKVEMQNITDIGVVRGCSVSTFKTTEGKVYFWGFAYGLIIPDPVETKFDSMAELFASLDTPMMVEPVDFHVKQPLLENLMQSFNDAETGDLKFMVDGKCIHAHRMVLQLRSEYFRRMFGNNWKENSNSDVLEVTDFTYHSFRTFVLYLYTDRIDPPLHTAEDAIELFKLADYYGEEDLKRRCEQQLAILITEKNASAVYPVSIPYNTKVLHDIVMDFIIPKFNRVVKTEGYRNMTDELQKRLIQDMAAENVFEGLKRKSSRG